MTVGKNQTKMAIALVNGLKKCLDAGRKPGSIGHRILADYEDGVGNKHYSGTLRLKKKNKAETADTTQVVA